MLACVGVRPSVYKTGSGVLPHSEVVWLLQNWQRWAANWLPELGVQPPPWAEQWLPNKHWDEGWGPKGDTVADAIPDPIIESDAVRVDKAIMRLAIEHVLTLKRHYINRRKQERERLDAAIRALGDIL